ncbi:programmed cell death protein 2-like [Dendronephthya gigantea]|uniref:programmed cell death protein 2-like n=1 Tax=Dendronephthya gigantea TaxID=151771 RepID=UPI00106A8275|nr:programmed cell death protein 2-like [Dendronephthya gigantea]
MADEGANLAGVKVDQEHCDFVDIIELGFLEKVEDPVTLTSPFFPSKIGGKPAWLALSELPSQILCKICEKPLVFLLQVYTPADDEKSPAYHRTVFVFCCRNGSCYKSNCNKSLKAFRCELPRSNDFYPAVSSFQDQDKIFQEFKDKKAGAGASWTKLCEVCGCRGEKLCSKCRQVSYCSRDHQTVDWKTGHKLVCGNAEQQRQPGAIHDKTTVVELRFAFIGSPGKVSNVLFPEFELVTEPEEIDGEIQECGNENDMEKYKDILKDNEKDNAGAKNDWDSLEAESKKINDVVEDKTYCEFKKRISYEPEQVLRYQQHGNPLWVSKLNIPKETDIPKCSCGATRTFEFQILPQLLNNMNCDSLGASIDWGTLAVYTCSRNCNSNGTSYYEEFVWKQDFSETGLPADILSQLQK